MTSSPAPTAARPGRPTLRWRGWPPWAWALMVFAAVCSLAIEVGGAFLILFTHSSTCYEQPYLPDVRAGQAALLRLMLACVAPWMVAAFAARPRARVAVTGLLCTAPIIYWWGDGLRVESWVGGFCF